MFFRIFFGFPAAALVTLALFFFMSGAIGRQVEFPPPEPPRDISILAKIKPTGPKPENTLKPKPVLPPATPPREFPTKGEKAPSPTGIGGPVGPTTGEKGEIVMSAPTIVLKTAPAYPEACSSRGAQGVVVVEFDVTAEGEVVNPRIISAADNCFRRTVLATVTKWKYSPDIDANGRAVPRRNVREQINFQLEE